MRNIILSFFFSLLLVNHNAQSQEILAGMHGTGDVYTDLIPDSVQMAVASHWSTFPYFDFPIDLDLDGVPDLEISSAGGGGLGGGGAGCGIALLQSYVQIASHYDTFQICCPTDVQVLMVNQFEFQDTISEASEYHHQPATIWSDGYGNTTSPIIYEWCDIGERYIGFRLCYSFDTLYGWIRVNAITPSHFEIHIMDYACNQNTSNINPTAGFTGAPIYPNPFIDELQLNASLSFPVQLVIFSSEGKKVIDKTFHDKTTFYTDFLSAGIYYYELKDAQDKAIHGKLIRRNATK